MSISRSTLHKTLAAALLAMITLGLSACGTSGGGSGSPVPPSGSVTQFLYSANLGSESQITGSISGFRITPGNGSLVALPGSPFSADFNPATLAADSAGKFLYVGQTGIAPGIRGGNCLDVQGKVLVESIAASGALSTANEITLQGSCPSSMVIDPSGSTLYVGDLSYLLGDYQVEAYALDGAGGLTAVTGSPFATPNSGNTLAFRPNGQTLYVGGIPLGYPAAHLTVFSRNSSGALTVQQEVPQPAVTDLSTTKAGDYLIAPLRDTSTSSDTIAVYSIDSSGNLSQLPSTTTSATNSGADTDPLGRFVAVTAFTGPVNIGFPGNISIYRFAAGALTSASSAPTGNTPGKPRFDTTGNYVYAPSYNGNVVNGYQVNATSGALTAVSGTATTGDFPSEIVIVKK